MFDFTFDFPMKKKMYVFIINVLTNKLTIVEKYNYEMVN